MILIKNALESTFFQVQTLNNKFISSPILVNWTAFFNDIKG